MALDKTKIKNYLLCMIMMVIGMLSVSIANVFGGYYCSVAVVETILFTVLIYNTFDKKIHSKETFVMLGIVSTITLLEVIFFVVNDIFGVDVYVKNQLDFWGVTVIVSQLLSIASIVYNSVIFVLNLNKSHIELIDKEEKQAEQSVEEKYENVEVEEEKQEEKIQKEIKSISESNMVSPTPFMEEEK